MKISEIGLIRVKAASPQLEIANVRYNVERILEEVALADKENVSVLTFPELGLVGYTCDDLFHQKYLLDNARIGLKTILEKTVNNDIILAVGLPYQTPDGRLYNAAFILHLGKILGCSLKKYLPNYSEFYDMRFFSSGLDKKYELEFHGQSFIAGNNLCQIKDKNDKILFTLGVSVCEDDWGPIQNSVDLALAGANLIVNLSASNELIGKSNQRRELLSQLSKRTHCAYVYASAGPNESVKDTVFGGHCLIYENGKLLTESERFLLDKTSYAISEVDIEKLMNERRKNTTFSGSKSPESFTIVSSIHEPKADKLIRFYAKNPFIDSSELVMDERSEEILSIQSTGLARTMRGTKIEKLLLGLSGGMDSTLTALVCIRALNKLGLPSSNLITVSMPGFGTSNRTKSQARELAKKIGSTFFEIDIKKALNQHFKDIKQPEGLFNATFENAQARERTQILLDLANKHNGLMVGSSSLSEIAIGFSTYGGDSISHINPIGSSPKSLSKVLIKYEIKINPELKNILNAVLATKISPELLPTTDKNEISQKSEDVVGDYNVIDFCLYHQINNGFSKKKIKYLLNCAYGRDFSKDYLDGVADGYFKRFYKNQFKRTMMPQCIKVGISLSPRSDWRMPDLADYFDES